jgi:hypothetical protein
LVTTQLNEPGDLAVHASGLYFTQQADNGAQGKVSKTALTGGPVNDLIANDPQPVYIATDDSHLYWSSNDGTADTLMKADLDGSNATTLVTGQDFTGDTRLLVVNGKAFWGDIDGVHSADTAAAGTATTVWPTTGSAQLFWADATGLYWSEINFDPTTGSTSTDYVRGALDGTGAKTVLYSASLTSSDVVAPNSFTADGNNAFLVTENGGVSTLHKFPIAGGSDTSIMTYDGDADWTVSDGTTVYFADDVASTNGIYSVPVAGGTATQLHHDGDISTSAGNARNLRLDAGHIYWVAGGFNLGQAVLHAMSR